MGREKPRPTPRERKAISDLEALARRWPKSLMLFSWSGSLRVFKPGDGRTFAEAHMRTIDGIPNDGGDPTWDDVAYGGRRPMTRLWFRLLCAVLGHRDGTLILTKQRQFVVECPRCRLRVSWKEARRQS